MKNIFRHLLLTLIRCYQASGFLWKPRCRYWPTCSEYAREAVERHGAARGAVLMARRMGRCHPLGSHGYDPVPLS